MPTLVGRSPRRPLRLLAVPSLVLALIAAVAIVFLTGQASSADPTAGPTGDATASRAARVSAGVHGTGRVIKGQWFGTWKLNGGVGFCIEFDKGHPNSSGTTNAGSSLPSMSAATSARVKYIANQYGTTSNKDDAAAAGIVVWKFQNTKRFNDYYKSMLKKKAFSKTILRRVSEIKAESAFHGPYKLSMSLGTGLPGQTVPGMIVARAKNNKVVGGKILTLTPTNAAVVSKARSTNANGQFAFRVRVARPGAIRVDARLAFKSLNGLLMTRPTAGHQRLLLAGKSLDTAKVTMTTVKALRGPAVKSKCVGDCHGISPVAVTMINPSGVSIRQYVLVNNVVKYSFVIPRGRTVTKGLNIADASVVTTKHCYLGSNGKCTTAVIDSKSRLTVVCPPLIEFKFAVDCPCDGARAISYSVRAPAGSLRKFNAQLTVNGKVLKKLALAPGNTAWTAFDGVRLTKGTTVKLSMSVDKLTFVKDLDSITSNL